MSKNNIRNDFIEAFEPLMSANGFSRKGRVFHRLVNGKIVQLVSHYSFYMDQCFTVAFSISPLFFGGEFDSRFEGMKMCYHEEFIGKVEPWGYVGTEGYKEYLPVALKATEELLLPKLNKEVDYESYCRSYRESKAFTMGWDKTSNLRYLTSIILGDYEDANETAERNYERSREYCMSMYGTEHYEDPWRQERFEQITKERAELKRAMDEGDRKYIDNYFAVHEQEALNSYVKIYSTPKKYEKYLETGILPFEIVSI